MYEMWRKNKHEGELTMAVIIEQAPPPESATQQSMGIMQEMMRWILGHFFGLAIIFIILLIIFLIIWWVMRKEEMRKEQEDMLYKEFKSTYRSCLKNQINNMYTRHYSKWNIIFIGFPVIHYKLGRYIYNKRQEFMGYYDGIYTDDYGNINILMWREKYLLFFKERFILRCPTKLFTLRETKKSKEVKENERKKEIKDYEVKTFTIPDGVVEILKHDLSIVIQMTGIKEHGYYFYPVYEDANARLLNLQESINAMNVLKHSDELLINVIKEGGKNVINMSKQNVPLVFEQKRPDKVRDIEKENTNN